MNAGAAAGWPPRGLCRAPGRRAFRVTGGDALSFLHRLTTQRLQGLDPGAHTRTLLLTTKGHVTADLSLHVRADGALCLVDAVAVEEAVAALRRYVLRADVSIELLDAQVAALLGQPSGGPERSGAPDVVTPPGGALPAGTGGEPTASGEPWEPTATLLPSPLHPYWTECLLPATATGRETTLPAAEVAGGAVPAAATCGGPPGTAATATPAGPAGEVSPEAFEAWRICAGIPRHGAELTGAEFPQEAGLEAAIDWDKGCYLGQETVARIHYRGHVNRLLVGLHGEGALARGERLVAGGRQVGVVTSAVTIPAGEHLALAYVRREQAQPGTVLATGTGAAVRVVRPPLAAGGS